MDDKCPFCHSPEDKRDSFGVRFSCGTWQPFQERKLDPDCQTWVCKNRQIATLQAELEAKSICMERALSDCHELIKQNAALQERVTYLESIKECDFSDAGLVIPPTYAALRDALWKTVEVVRWVAIEGIKVQNVRGIPPEERKVYSQAAALLPELKRLAGEG